MSIISKEFLTSNLQFAIRNVPSTLTQISPTTSVTVTFAANKQGLEIAFTVLENGREATIDTRFYIADEGQTLPRKGFVLSDGEQEYKVISRNHDATKHTLRIDCEARHQR